MTEPRKPGRIREPQWTWESNDTDIRVGRVSIDGMDLDDQLTPQEANKQDERVRVVTPDEEQAEIDRLSRALEVCSYVLHLRNPTPAELHAGQQASEAWFTDDWQPNHVHDDIPNFLYQRERTLCALDEPIVIDGPDWD